MPIRFRCAYCAQLMGIAKRKAGSVVKCPKCAGEIIVPTPEGHEAGPEGVELAGHDMPETSPHAAMDDNTTVATETSAPMPVLPPPPPPERLGIFLSVGSLVVSVIVIILLMILMFVLGLIIGKSTGAAMSTACGGAIQSGTTLRVVSHDAERRATIRRTLTDS